jgi:hypothetical protein
MIGTTGRGRKLIFGRVEYASQVLLLDGIEW